MFRLLIRQARPRRRRLPSDRPYSKDQLQTELQLSDMDPRACAGDLDEGAHAGDWNTAGSELIGVQANARVSPVRVIGGVEGFKPELQISTLAEIEILQCRKIPTENPRVGNNIA